MSIRVRHARQTMPTSTSAFADRHLAIFMSLLVSLLLIIILYVGVSAIAGLEVSYMAFSKEMGPAAQKQKQQS